MPFASDRWSPPHLSLRRPWDALFTNHSPRPSTARAEKSSQKEPARPVITVDAQDSSEPTISKFRRCGTTLLAAPPRTR